MYSQKIDAGANVYKSSILGWLIKLIAIHLINGFCKRENPINFSEGIKKIS